ncbi:hypothetical protein OGAPHI_002921 [Ogataea philodendri]|uniref:Ubiquinone biosynthesis O-methyltransferase, mitochondrial n=1 Tax=Ogataea philodendri TaxID=1378263 RepID=A0A9P8P9J0_9ASCO|nr:uncharacterized protein OGAPHI_002921 [Ogataea philodendri]KAH3667272.1 hypothetical protein OGAPHI_002921 [Ogataea philodendri]
MFVRRLSTAISESEKAHFNNLATSWWDTTGPQRILHKMNLVRMDFINNNIKQHIKINNNVPNEQKTFIPGWNPHNVLPEPVANTIDGARTARIRQELAKMRLSCLDIGCGGGILSESLARLPYVESVDGIDMSPEVVRVANEHKLLDPAIAQKVHYQLKPVGELPATKQYDVVTLMELLEHVDHPADVMAAAMSHVKPGGLLFLSTINRDPISWLTTILFGEYVLRIVPVGTHTYSKYIDCAEIAEFVEHTGFSVIDSKGCTYLPLKGWVFTDSPDVGNYFMALQRVK